MASVPVEEPEESTSDDEFGVEKENVPPAPAPPPVMPPVMTEKEPTPLPTTPVAAPAQPNTIQYLAVDAPQVPQQNVMQPIPEVGVPTPSQPAANTVAVPSTSVAQ